MARTNINVGGNIDLSNLSPEVELTGDWEKASAFINKLPLAVAIGVENGKMAAAEKLLTMVKANIRKGGVQGYHWPPLKEEYLKNKLKKGGDSSIWRYTSTYYDNIQIIKRGNNIHVGVPARMRGKVNSEKPLTLTQIGNILENGSSAAGIAARPLWGPTLKQFGGKYRVNNHIVWHIRNTIFAMTGVRASVSV